jgi:SAM-dependent methyltransferase
MSNGFRRAASIVGSTSTSTFRESAGDSSCFEGPLSPRVKKLWLRFYANYRPDLFCEIVQQSARKSDHVLEVGAGSGTGNEHNFCLRGKVARYVGLDPDPRVMSNPYLDESHVGVAESLPFRDASFDFVFHRFVAEHLKSPLAANREIARVLKPGGLLLFQTPSRYYYPMVVANLTPHWFHVFCVGNFGSRRMEAEVFRTYYRLNDDRAIQKHLVQAGFDFRVWHLSTPPGYLRFSPVSFLGGVLFERTIERAFPALRGCLIVEATKAEAQNSP